MSSNKFQIMRSRLEEYGILPTSDKTTFRLREGESSVSLAKNPAGSPFMITIVPPKIFPSGLYRVQEIPSPQDIPLALTSLKEGGKTNIIGTIAPDKILVYPSSLGMLQGTSETISYSIRDRLDRVLDRPVKWTSTNEEVVSVRNGTLYAVGEGTATVTVTAIGADAPVRAVVRVTVGQVSSGEGNPIPEPSGLEGDSPSNLKRTLVSISDESETSESEYLSTLTQRYVDLQKSAGLWDRDQDLNREIVVGRERVRDTHLEASQRMEAARTLETDEEYIREQVLALRELPPFLMYINPSEFSLSYNHVISDGSKTRKGHIVEHWGLEMPTLSASGKVGGFYTKEHGLTTSFRTGSLAFQKLMNLFMIYRNNGCIYNADNVIAAVGAIQIYYNNTIYTGSFDSFSITENEAEAYTLSYSMAFTIRYEEKIT